MPLPTAFNFWNQAHQQGYKPKIAVIGRATLMPSAIEAMGSLGEVPVAARSGGRATIRSSPVSRVRPRGKFGTGTKRSPRSNGCRRSVSAMPCSKSRTMFSSGRRTRNRMRRLSMRSATPISAPSSVRYNGSAIRPTSMSHIPFKNVCTTPLVRGQWVPGKKWPYDLVVTGNESIL